MSVKLTCNHMQLPSDADLVECAQKCCDAYIKVAEEGLQLEEMQTILSNITFARDTIKSRGAKWYIDNCDPMNTFGNMLGVAENKLSVSAAQEGFFSAVCEFIAKLFKWILSCLGFNNDACEKNEKNLVTIRRKTDEIKKEAADPGRIQKSGESKQDYYKRRFQETKIRPLYFKVWDGLFTSSEFKRYEDAEVVTNEMKYSWEKRYDYDYEFYAIKYKNLSSVATSMVGLMQVCGSALVTMNKFAEEAEKLVKEGTNSSTSIQSEGGVKTATREAWYNGSDKARRDIYEKLNFVYKALVTGCTKLSSNTRDEDARISLSDFGFSSEQDILDLPKQCQEWVIMANNAKTELSKHKSTAERLSKMTDTGYEKNSESYKYLKFIGSDLKSVVNCVEHAITISVKITDYLRDVVNRFGDVPDAGPKQLT